MEDSRDSGLRRKSSRVKESGTILVVKSLLASGLPPYEVAKHSPYTVEGLKQSSGVCDIVFFMEKKGVQF